MKKKQTIRLDKKTVFTFGAKKGISGNAKTTTTTVTTIPTTICP